MPKRRQDSTSVCPSTASPNDAMMKIDSQHNHNQQQVTVMTMEDYDINRKQQYSSTILPEEETPLFCGTDPMEEQAAPQWKEAIENDDNQCDYQYNASLRQNSEDRDEKPIDTSLEYVLPLHNVARYMRAVVPETMKITKEAKVTVVDCASEFICFVAAEAADHCSEVKQRTITGEDILKALASLGFDQYIAPMTLFYDRLRSTKTSAAIASRRSSSFPTATVPSLSPPPAQVPATITSTSNSGLDLVCASASPSPHVGHPGGAVEISNLGVGTAEESLGSLTSILNAAADNSCPLGSNTSPSFSASEAGFSISRVSNRSSTNFTQPPL